MTVAGEPDVTDLKSWLGLANDDTADDVVLEESMNAALSAQAKVVTYPDEGFVDDLREAVFLRAQRLAARRNSPEGVVGLTGTDGDFVGARVPSYDADVGVLEGPYRTMVVA